MAKNYSQRKRTRKSVIAALCALSVTCTGLAAACTPEKTDEDPATPSKEDTQLLKNGNFEFFDVPKDAVYLINKVNSWTLGGDSSVMSGIIGTSEAAWEKLVADDLKDKLDYNNDVGSSSDDYVDYNSMRSRDILYKDPYAATLEADKVKDDKYINKQGVEAYFGIENGKIGKRTVYKDEESGEYYFDEEHTDAVRFEKIANPETHLGSYSEKDGKYYLGETEVYKDDDGNLYTDDKKENSVGNVLMVHNYATDGKYNGIQQYYSSTTLTLEANTAAEISLWVKTSDLKFDKGYSALEEQDKGAFIEVLQTVNGTTIDSFVVKNINTEKIINNAVGDGVTLKTESNGWLNYTVYVNACDFASSTIQLRLGLGQSDGAEKCTGYAFFDDVSVTKYRDLEAEGCTYKDNKDAITTAGTSCTLTSEEDDKIFNADKEIRENQGARHSYNFHYAIDLASENTDASSSNTYTPIKFGNNVTAALTSEKDGGKNYASAEEIAANVIKSPVTAGTTSGSKYDLVKNFEARPTENDLIGVYGATEQFTASLFNGTDYSSLLNGALIGEGNDITVLPKYDAANSNMLVTLSAWGAAYTSTISDATNFTVAKSGYQIVSFWVKTSDMNGKPAANIKIYQVNGSGEAIEDAEQSLKVESTNITTNFGDEKNIYNGWVQCFFFIENKTDDAANYKIDFSFGNTTIKDATSFEGGWAAIANLQTLNCDEEVYKLASANDRTALLSITKSENENEGKKMDEATGTSDIKTGIATPSNYSGINGANSSIVSGAEAKPVYDGSNNNALAGLINKDYAEKYSLDGTDGTLWSKIATSFGKTSSNWNDVFGEDCYQPLIIINNIREYVEKATATEETYSNYLVAADDGNVTINGKTYKTATEWDPDETYYTQPSKVSNYGFVANSATVSANSYQPVSVKVMVSGDATAYIYLVDADNPKSLLSYTTPGYTFWYDEEGNVLDEELDKDWKENEHRAHIVYKYNDKNGLYEKYPESDGKTYANLYNLVKNYRNYKFEHDKFYDEDGKEVSFDDLVNGETYYNGADKNTRVLANHYLTNTAGTRVYEYVDGTYYYLEEGKRTVEVTNFEKTLARYDYTALNEPMCVEVGNTNGEWKTVNFLIHTGSEAKKYRLELWNGKRDEVGDVTTEKTGAVAFDYSSYSVNSDNYANVIGEYEQNIINEYKQILVNNGNFEKISSNEENIAYFEETLVKEGLLTENDVKTVKAKFGDYTAKYYNYTLYDSESYVPFNASTAADGETGYDYNASDFGETLAYFTYSNDKENSYNVFVDYSAVDQSISIGSASDDEEDKDEDEKTGGENLWLYISSIVLVVVLLITLIALLIKELVKKIHIRKNDDKKKKNVYRKRDRYIKKLHLVKNDEEAPAETDADANEAPAGEVPEETPAEEAPEETTETTAEPVEEAPAETTEEVTEESSDEVVSEETTETPAEDTPSGDDGNKE